METFLRYCYVVTLCLCFACFLLRLFACPSSGLKYLSIVTVLFTQGSAEFSKEQAEILSFSLVMTSVLVLPAERCNQGHLLHSIILHSNGSRSGHMSLPC
jgi:hypothetical protein